jgi:hypothetical protein
MTTCHAAPNAGAKVTSFSVLRQSKVQCTVVSCSLLL